jgi:hypothetical protein
MHGGAAVLGERMAVDAVRFISNMSAFEEVRGLCVCLDQRPSFLRVFRMGFEIGIEAWRRDAEGPKASGPREAQPSSAPPSRRKGLSE